ncbi:hypothetical protein [Wukongibacter sp. M2B1]|uniref:hypothetical protein n=1 Tax=Wukongibacter sp. M2B1 TaxID=3088895 RepID=UPI003D79D4D4
MSKYEKIIVLNNEIEARLMDEILKDRQIPHIIQSYYSSAYGVIFQFSGGWGHIEAESKYRNQIISIYNEVKR